jgi:hypothetical protein
MSRPNRSGILRVSIEKDLNVQLALIDSDREKNSASNEIIFNESKMYFDGCSGQKLIFEVSGEYPGSLLLLNKIWKKGDICNKHAQVYPLIGI